MSMQLKIELPDNLVVKGLLPQKKIPCLCRIGGSAFELLLQDPLPQATGTVGGWTQRDIDARAPAGAGGQYTHYCLGMVTLEAVGEHIFNIVDLSFFVDTLGWLPIVEGGEWCPPRQWNTQEELDELDAMFPPRNANKKRQRLLDSLARVEPANKGQS
jgi:hypothetical protein